MKKFRWILLSGLLVAATSVAQAQAPAPAPGAPGATGAADAGAISNAPAAATTTTTTTTGVSPDVAMVAPDDAAMNSDSSSSMPNTGGEPMIAVLAGLSIAGAAFAMRRKVTA